MPSTFDPANYWGKTWRYRGCVIERVFPSGYYSARVEVQGGGKASHVYGEQDLYVGDDGRLHI